MVLTSQNIRMKIKALKNMFFISNEGFNKKSFQVGIKP